MSFWLLVEARAILVTVLAWMVAMILVLVGVLDPSWIMGVTFFFVMTLLSFTFLLGFAYVYSTWKQKSVKIRS